MHTPFVICGFPGVGKTTFFNHASALGIKILDSDSSKFDKSQFPQNYIAHIKQALVDGYFVMCSTRKVVREALRAEGIIHVIVVPQYISQKDEYLQRYIDRGSPEAFVNLMREKWDEFWSDCAYAGHQTWVYALRPGQYLSQASQDLLGY